MKTLHSILKLTVVFAVLSMACKGPQGDVGPAGATGAQGPTGAAGATGPAGAAGSSAATNITTSAWIGVSPADWSRYNNDAGTGVDSTYFDATFREKGITQSVLDKGAVMVYAKVSNDFVYPLPLSFPGGTTVSFLPIFDATEGGLMNVYFLSGKNIKVPTSDWGFRWVIIKDLTVSNGRLKSIDWKNYEEVKKELNLKD